MQTVNGGGDRVKCQYFGKCAGCQYQMLDYDVQLEVKKGVVERAYENFSGLSSTLSLRSRR